VVTLPSGFTVIPISKDQAVGEQVAATAAVPVATEAVTTAPVTTPPVVAATVTTGNVTTTTAVVAPTSDYTVPMLGIPTFKKGDESKLKIDFTGAAEGARANLFVEPHKNGKMTSVRMRFHDMKEAPKGLAYVLWAVSPDNQFQRLGSIVNVRGRNEAEIQSETAFDDFGLLLTTEDVSTPATVLVKPAGARVGVIQIIK